MTDDDLLRELAAALAEAQDVPPGFLTSARELLAWRTVDAELAELVHDSLAGAGGGALLRSAGSGPRSLTFRAAGLTIDLDVDLGPGRTATALRGQVVPGAGSGRPAQVVVQPFGGDPVTAEVDDVGYFAVAPVPAAGRRFRLRCGPLVTPWID